MGEEEGSDHRRLEATQKEVEQAVKKAENEDENDEILVAS